MFRACKITEGEETVEIHIRYVATCDIYAQALANFVERNRDNSEIWSEGCRQKASGSLLAEKSLRTELERRTNDPSDGRCTSFSAIAWCDDGLGMRYVSGTDTSMKRSATVAVTSSERAITKLYRLLGRVHEGRMKEAANLWYLYVGLAGTEAITANITATVG